jgi:type I restriction enzyme S subunit
MLSTSWEKYKLVDILENIESGKRPYGGADEYSGIIPSIGGENIKTNGQMDYTTIKRIPFDYFRTMTSGHLFPSDVLINKDGAQTGKVGLYRGKYPEAAVNEHVFIIRGSSAYTTQLYLYYLLLWSNVQQQINQVATGSAQPGINSKFANYIDIRLPPLPEQRRIAEILEIADEAIRATERVIAKLKQVQKGLLHDLLTRGLDENGLLRDPEAHPEQFKDSPLGRIPKEWEVGRIIEVAETYAGGTPNRSNVAFYDGEIPWVKSSELNQVEIDRTEESITSLGYQSSSTKWVPPNTPLIAMYGATAGVVGWLSIQAVTNQAVLAVIPSFNINSRWLFWELSFRSPKILASIQGSGQPNLSKSLIDSSLIRLPKYIEQGKIADILDQHNAHIRAEEAKLAKLKQVKLGLMDDLLTGKVRVS